MKNHYDIIIVGAGAAGLFAASYATHLFQINQSSSGEDNHLPTIALLEKMPRGGRKINITGKGSCNLTNTRMWDEFSVHIHPNQSFLKNAFYNLSSSDLMDFFKNSGLDLVVERGQRVYPKSKRAMDVTDTLVDSILKGGFVDYITSTKVEDIDIVEGGGFIVKCSNSNLHQEDDYFKISTSNLLITTGGLSYPSTGSTGDGYRFAKKIGHSISTLFPSLTALVPVGYKNGKELSKIGKLLSGIGLKNVQISLNVSNNIVQEEFGELEFTSGGLEGALGFRVSRKAVAALINGQKVYVRIDLKPAISLEKLSLRIANEIKTNNSSKSDKASGTIILKRVLPKLLPARFIAPFSHYTQIRPDSFYTPNQIAHYLKNFTIEIVGYVGYERAVVTAGGVSLKEVSSKSMESKLIKGLFFAGEILDIDADTGGYNLQCAFSSAALAIKNILNKF